MYSIEKLRKVFPDTTVYKDQSVMAPFRAAAVPSFLRDWILKRKAGADGRIDDVEELSKYIADIIPRRDHKLILIDAARQQGETKKFLAKVDIQFNINNNHYSFELSDLGISHKDTLIEDYVWNRIKDEILHKSGGWGLVKLGYCPPEDSFDKKGRFTLLEYKDFCP
jgi:ATP-dependent Lon protease